MDAYARVSSTKPEVLLCYIPGALTPTEVISAWNRGVPTVKVSPIGPLGGLDYFRELLMPMPDVAVVSSVQLEPAS
jgi:2-dehydro-3-deoxyphosphogluconate aldolase / (4S)-4-hydroxy-2-oxoglutarate aldolase